MEWTRNTPPRQTQWLLASTLLVVLCEVRIMRTLFCHIATVIGWFLSKTLCELLPSIHCELAFPIVTAVPCMVACNGTIRIDSVIGYDFVKKLKLQLVIHVFFRSLVKYECFSPPHTCVYVVHIYYTIKIGCVNGRTDVGFVKWWSLSMKLTFLIHTNLQEQFE